MQQPATNPLTEATALRERVRADLDAQRKLLAERIESLSTAIARRETEQDPALNAYLETPLPSLVEIRVEVAQITERVQLATEALCQAGRRVDAARLAASRAFLATQDAEVARLQSQFDKAATLTLAAYRALTDWESSFVEKGLDAIGYETAQRIAFVPPRVTRFEFAAHLSEWLKNH